MNLTELPGAALILPGVKDLQNGEVETVGALLIAIASTRLTEAGLEFPKDHRGISKHLISWNAPSSKSYDERAEV